MTMHVVGIDLTKCIRKMFLCSNELAAEIDTYRRAQKTIPSESQAVVELIRLGLVQWREQASNVVSETKGGAQPKGKSYHD
jgi:hypothetical protein